jgi:N-acetylglutamate synthase-like GNAT family acetyltransferase
VLFLLTCLQVATIHDLLIHPDLQGFGIGSHLLKRLVTQIGATGVYDVGLVTPSELQPFFRSCSFDLDHEDSVPMGLQPQLWSKSEEDTKRDLAGNHELQARLLKALDP